MRVVDGAGEAGMGANVRESLVRSLAGVIGEASRHRNEARERICLSQGLGLPEPLVL